MLTLRPYQQAAIDAIYGYFAGNAGHPLVVIPTAGGKIARDGRVHRGRAAAHGPTSAFSSSPTSAS